MRFAVESSFLFIHVIPVETGIQWMCVHMYWAPAFAGVTLYQRISEHIQGNGGGVTGMTIYEDMSFR